MRIDILTIFPSYFESPLSVSLLKRAREKGALEVTITDIRSFTFDKHRTVDDEPYGGGPGMVMKPEPIYLALRSLPSVEPRKVVYLTPDGVPFSHSLAQQLSELKQLVLICGRYEGIDERIRERFVDLELSIGDYVISGGEAAALVVMEAVVRLLPGVLGDPESARQDSFADGLLDFPHYTRPAEFLGMRVPEVLLSGDHKRIARWRRKMQLLRTMQRRPELLEHAKLSEEDKRFLAELAQERSEE